MDKIIGTFRCVGPCWTDIDGCECFLHDGLAIIEGHPKLGKPPLHDGCTCYVEPIDPTKEALSP